ANRKKSTMGSQFVPLLTVGSRRVQDGVEVRIRDNGNGVAEAIRDKLFLPFFTTKPTGQGTGLGLSISYDIVVHEHKGSLSFETVEGEYTEFVIFLPEAQ
ncbi:histidine kinase, partial [bacterium]|nr:histidine kinase [bacterium]